MNKMKNISLPNTSSLVVLDSIEIDGIDTSDFPDFCDAFVSSAKFEDGTSLTSEEMELIPSKVVYELVLEEIH
jgi:hypothetical protein